MNRIYSGKEFQVLTDNLSPELTTCLSYCAGNDCPNEKDEDGICPIIERAEQVLTAHKQKSKTTQAIDKLVGMSPDGVLTR